MSRMKRWRYALAALLAVASPAAFAVAAEATPPGSVDYNTVAPVSVQAFGRDIQSPDSSQAILFGAKLVAATPIHFDQLVFAIRSSSGTNYDVGNRTGYDLGTTQQVFTASRPALPAGTGYTVWLSYEIGTTWTDLSPNPAQTFSVASAPPGNPVPNGPAGPWTSAFSDEFSGTSVDTTKWGYKSSAESDQSSNPVGTGNPGNQQLEFDQPGNCSVSGGILNITTKPDSITSSSGHHYNWSSCMLNTSPSFSYRYGYIETSAKFPANKGDWPALWTWAAAGQNLPGNGETDAFEYYSDNKTKLYQTQHNTGGGSCTYTLPFDPTTGYHTYGVDIETTGTKWYVDGVQTCSVTTTSAGLTNVLLDNFVYANIPPAPGQVDHLLVDYVRAWHH